MTVTPALGCSGVERRGQGQHHAIAVGAVAGPPNRSRLTLRPVLPIDGDPAGGHPLVVVLDHGEIMTECPDDREPPATVQGVFETPVGTPVAGRIVHCRHLDGHLAVPLVGSQRDQVASVMKDAVGNEFGRHDQLVGSLDPPVDADVR